MLFRPCNPDHDAGGAGFCIPQEILYSAAGVAALLVILVLILSICLCRICRKRKKKKLTEGMDVCPEEANLHYAELQNLPDSGRGQCDGGTCPPPPVPLSSEYATIAELTESTSEGNRGNHQQIEDDGVENGNPYSVEPVN